MAIAVATFKLPLQSKHVAVALGNALKQMNDEGHLITSVLVNPRDGSEVIIISEPPPKAK